MKNLYEILKLSYKINIVYALTKNEFIKKIIYYILTTIFLLIYSYITYSIKVYKISSLALFLSLNTSVSLILQYFNHLIKNDFNYKYIQMFHMPPLKALVSRLTYRNCSFTNIVFHMIEFYFISLYIKPTPVLCFLYISYVLMCQIEGEMLNVIGKKIFSSKILCFSIISLVSAIQVSLMIFFIPEVFKYKYFALIIIFLLILIFSVLYSMVYVKEIHIKEKRFFKLSIYKFIFSIVSKMKFVDDTLRYLILKDILYVLRCQKLIFVYCFIFTLSSISLGGDMSYAVFCDLIMMMPEFLAINSFSLDGNGVLSLFYSKVDEKKILISKNITAAIFMIISFLFYSVFYILIGKSNIFSNLHFLIMLIPGLLIIFSISNWLSISFPYAKGSSFSDAPMQAIKSTLIYFLLSLITIIPIILVVYFVKNLTIFLTLSAVLSIITFIVYFLSLNKASDKLSKNKYGILQKLILKY